MFPYRSAVMFLAVSFAGISISAKDYRLTSPGENVKVTVSVSDSLRFSIWYGDDLVLEPSAIALDVKGKEDFFGAFPKVRKTEEERGDRMLEAIVPLKSRYIRDHFNSLKLTFAGGWAVCFRAYDNGVAYRFETSCDGTVFVRDEVAKYCFAQDADVYWADERNPEFISHCEAYFKEVRLSEIDKGGYSYLPVSLRTPAGTRVVVTETDLYDYPNLFLGGGSGTMLSGKFPRVILETEMRTDRDVNVTRKADYIAETAGARTYPWRIFTLGDDRSLLENNLPYQLASPEFSDDTEWIRPGKISWDWWSILNVYGVDFKAGVNNETYRYFIDFAAENGLEYVLMDEGWSASTYDIIHPKPGLDVKGLIEYGRRKGVGIVLWTLWAPVMNDMETVLDTYRDWGVSGIKIDFMQMNDQSMVNFYEDVARECFKRHLIVDFHGCFKPAGLQRKYPNVLSFEGVYGMEHDKCSYDISPEHDLTLPFTRMVAGPMDYTPGATINATKEDFAVRWAHPMSQGTRAHQAAIFIAFESGVQMLCDSPSNYYREQKFTDFIADIPVVWDETRALEARAGDYLLLARRNGDDWYVAGLTDWSERELSLDLGFLGNGKYVAEIFMDGVNSDVWAEDYRLVTESVSADDVLSVKMAPGGGWAAVIRPVPEKSGAACADPVVGDRQPCTVAGEVTSGGVGVPDVCVTDGFSVVVTDEEGRYSLHADPEAGFVYLSVPSGYRVDTGGSGSPVFYRSIAEEKKRRESGSSDTLTVDFSLSEAAGDENRHIFALWADIQVYEESELKYVAEAAADFRKLVSESRLPAFGVACGDIIGDWSHQPSLFLPVAQTVAESGVPFSYVIGNHDLDMDARSNALSKGTFCRMFGPTYYSFNKGRVHYVVLDNVFYLSRGYVGYIEESQLEWLERDLALVEPGSTVIVFIHIPTFSREARAGDFSKEESNRITANRNALYRILEPYKAHICSAHEHYAENYILSDALFEHVHPPLSGLFWQSPWSSDGVPWGYMVYEIDGDDVTWYYKPVGKGPEMQFSAFPVGEDPLNPDCIVVNVWNWDPGWKVCWYEDGVFRGEMGRFSGYDRNISRDVEERRESEFKWKYLGAGETEHLFRAEPADPESRIVVEVTDRFGRICRADL